MSPSAGEVGARPQLGPSHRGITMLVIIVGDDQALRLQLARALGPGRYELLCAVPNADGVPPVEEDERLAALLAHKTPAAMKADIERLRKRYQDRVALIAVATAEGRELEGLVAEVDDFVAWALGPTFLQARLQIVQRRLTATRTSRQARPVRSPIDELVRAALGSGRDQLYVWELATGRIDWPFAAAADHLPTTRHQFEDAIHPDDRMQVEVALERHFAAQIPYAVSVRRGDPDRGWTMCVDRGELLGARRDGRFVGLVTEVEAEVQVELGRRMEARRSNLAEIAGALAEELSQSLVAAFTALDGVIPMAPPGLKGDLDDARTALQGALDWTRRLLTLGRRQPPNPEYIALQDLVQDLVDPLARRLGSHVAFEVVSKDASGIVLADPLHIETVLSILCDRAAKQMPGGGRVRLTLATTLLRDEVGPMPPRSLEGRWAKLRVEDQGRPLPEALIAGGFDPMAHGLHEGLRWAIALATVRSIVLQHEGFVRALNTTDEAGRPTGVAFEVFLPLVVRAPARLRRPTSGLHLPVGSGELVLVADDDELMRRLTERLLRGHGYDVITAADGREAVRVFQERKDEVRLVILDIVMPEMGGRLASARILAVDPDIPLLFTSGYTMSIQDTEFVQEPGRRFLPKPFNAGQLLREVRAALTGQPV